MLLLDLSDLYGIDFGLLASWSGLVSSADADDSQKVMAALSDHALKRLLRLVKQLSPEQCAQVLAIAEDLVRSPGHNNVDVGNS